MKKRLLGDGLEVSAIGLGCMGFSHAYGVATDRAEAIHAIREAFDMGYTMFDTAECYTGAYADGTTSYNEELVGKALTEVRGNVQIATTFGVRHEGRTVITDSNPAHIRQSVENSLKRLGTDHIDLYYQHRIDPRVPAEEVAETMADLIREGKILHWGISEATEEYLRRAHAVCPVACVQNRFSMMIHEHERLFPVLEELGIGFVAFSPLANGILTGAYGEQSKFADDDYRSAMPQYRVEAYEQNREFMAYLSQLAAEKNATPAQISLAWMLAKKPYIVPIPGSRKIERLRENALAAEIELSSTEIPAIDDALTAMPMSAVFGGSSVKQE